jgi:Tol biopolymer transport system component
MNADGSDQRNLTQNLADDSLPIWSPDGTQLAFFSTRTGYFEIHIINLADASVTQVTDTSGTNTAYVPILAWSPDGRYLLAARTDPWAVRGYHHHISLDLIRTDNFQVTTLSQFEQALVINLSWSPDSRYIAVHLSTPNSYGIQIGNLSVTPFELRPTDNCFAGGWTHDGNFSCYSDTNLYSLDVTAWTKDFIVAAPDIEDIAWSPDGKYLFSIDYAYSTDDQVFRVILPENSGLNDPLFKQDNIMADYTDRGDVPFSGSSTGQWLTYDSTENNQSNIYILNIFDAENPIQLTRNSNNNYAPQWQPQP